MSRKLACAAAITALLFGACKSDRCESEAPSFQLDVRWSDARAGDVRALRIELEAGDDRFRRTFDLSNRELQDGETSIAVTLEPPPSSELDLTIRAYAMDDASGLLAEGTASHRAEPNGCNQIALALAASGGPADGGVDAGIDTGVEPGPDVDPGDTGDPGDGPILDAPDGGIEDTGVFPDAEPGDTGILPDAEPGDTGVFPDAEPIDTGVEPDAGVIDGGQPVAFPYAPANFDPLALAPSMPLNLDCGAVTFNSDTLTFSTTCGRPAPVATTAQNGALIAAVVPVTRFDLAPGSSLSLTGSRPVIFAVFGPATIGGDLLANADHEIAGAGGSIPGTCPVGDGDIGAGRGGGGGAGFASSGGSGGDGAGESGGEGGEEEPSTLAPLRGGCFGASGVPAGGLGGGGGGAVQISSATTLRITGLVQAAGGGGRGGDRRAGGGGGGSGGGIYLQGDVLDVTVTARVNARGGGGGGGGAQAAAIAGGDGDNGTVLVPNGGNGGAGEGGRGGNGGTGFAGPGDGLDGITVGQGAGGGGGGGAEGRIRLFGNTTCNDDGTLQPPAQCP